MTSHEIDGPSAQVLRIMEKIRKKGVKLNPPITWEELNTFEKKHDILLPPHYREFILEAGNGGEGPAGHGLVKLGEVPESMNEWEIKTWTRLEHIKKEFPFTEAWEWEPSDWEIDDFEDKIFPRITHGNISIGGDYWNMQWHLIVTGPARGTIWVFHEEGVYPVKGNPDFQMWYEAWLDDDAMQV